MPDPSELCFAGILIFFVFMFVALYFSARKVKCGEIPAVVPTMFLQHYYALASSMGWKTTVDYATMKMTVEKDALAAALLVFKPMPGGFEIYRGVHTTGLGWVLTVVMILFAMPIALVIGIVMHYRSVSFAKNELVPLLLANPPPRWGAPAGIPYSPYPQQYMPPPQM